MNTVKNSLKHTEKSKLFVALGSRISYEKQDAFSRNFGIQEASTPDGLIYYEVNSLEEASLLTQKFITTLNLGSSNWVGGKVCDEHFNFIAHISYNGKIWDNEDWKIAKEIEL